MSGKLNALLSKYKEQSGKDYSHTSYPNPNVTPSNLRQLVASIKVLKATIQRDSIESEIQASIKLNDGNVAALRNQVKQLDDEITSWGVHI